MANINMDAIEYIRKVPPPFRAIIEELRALIFDLIPDIGENFRNDIPIYEKDGKVCFIKKDPNQHVKFGFFDGILDPHRVLDGVEQDKKYMLITEVGDITEKKVPSLLKEVFDSKK
ncbi:MAG: DUF1801 domain-containing protein [Candidatus Lokiarchaeota archaeon]|nr:DUF1801 domain-containing protein [Candidatus Lokiarchaeota archaeon]